MRKYSLKLLDDDNKGYKVKLINNTKNNITQLNARVKIKDSSILISYSEGDIKRIGFINIEKVEIYKISDLIYSSDKISNYQVEFPSFSSDGIYEIRTIISNKGGTIKRSLISSFEFFKYDKNFKCDDFKLSLTQVDNNLSIKFNKKLGDIDLGDIILPSISLMNSEGISINNISCKLNCTGNRVNFVILDVFNDHKISKLIPNEVYTLKISIKGKDILKSFYFEYTSEDMYSYDIVEDIKFDIREEVYPNLKKGTLYIRLNSLINVEEYEYVLCNVQSKFIYFKSSIGDNKDTLVFECTLKDDTGYFEINMFGDSMIPIFVDYDFLNEEKIWVRKYIDKLIVERNVNKYDISFFNDNINESDVVELKKFSKDSESSFVGEVNSSNVYFKDVIILSKSSEIYLLTINSSIVGSFILSRSIGVLFKQNNYSSEFISDGILLNLEDKNSNMFGEVIYKNSKERSLNTQEGSCLIEYSGCDLTYIKLIGEDKKTYYETLCVYQEEKKASIKYYTPENVYIDHKGNLVILDKNLLEEFGEEFYITVTCHGKEDVFTIYLENVTTPRIVISGLNIIEDDIYYIRITKDEKYKVYSMSISAPVSNTKIFIKDIDKEGFDISVPSLINNDNFYLEANLFIVLDKCVYTLIDQKIKNHESDMRIDFSNNILIENTEYLVNFKFKDGREEKVSFVYLGEGYFNYIEDNADELNKALLIESNEVEEDIYDFYIDKKCEDNTINLLSEISCDDIDIIIKKAFDVFLNFEISQLNREFILWKNLIRDNKVDLKYFIEVFMLEYIFRFKDDLDFREMIKLILRFLNIEENSIIKSIDFNIEDPYEFLHRSLELVLGTQEYKDMECVFNKNNEL